MRAPAYFGEIGILREIPRTANVDTLTACRCALISGASLLEALSIASASSSLVATTRSRLARTHPLLDDCAHGSSVSRAPGRVCNCRCGFPIRSSSICSWHGSFPRPRCWRAAWLTAADRTPRSRRISRRLGPLSGGSTDLSRGSTRGRYGLLRCNSLEPLATLHKLAVLQVFLDGHGWFRTTDLSRVKRALSR
jgi:hypothetical protein